MYWYNIMLHVKHSDPTYSNINRETYSIFCETCLLFSPMGFIATVDGQTQQYNHKELYQTIFKFKFP